MKKIINAPENYLADAISGFCRAHQDVVRYDAENRVILRANAKASGKVALLSGGGSGHEPMHGGFVGTGMLDAACLGEVFTSPTPDQMMAAAQEVDRGAGVLFIVKNYSGDVMNFDIAAQMSPVVVYTVIVDDDVALIGMETGNSQGNRGVAGTIVVEKIVGAAAEAGSDIAACVDLAKSVNDRTGSMAIALSSCIVPTVGTPNFDLGQGEAELGVGIHGEAGRERIDLPQADEIAETLLEPILEKVSPQADEPLLLLTNGLGATPSAELYLLHNSAAKVLERRGLKIARQLVGSFCTALDMVGASLTVTALDDEKLRYWDAQADTAALR